MILATFVGKEFVAAAAYATDHAGRVLTINAAITVVYLVLFIPKMGLIGAGVAAVLPLIALSILIHKSINKLNLE